MPKAVRQACSGELTCSFRPYVNSQMPQMPASQSQRRSARVHAADPDPSTSSSSNSSNGPISLNVLQILRERGLVADITSPALEDLAGSTALKVYCGFDPTADSLHLGNLLGILVLAWFQRCGHQPVALVGGATGLVGDPSGKSSERPVLSDLTIAANVEGIRAILSQLLSQPAATAETGVTPPLHLVNNLDWYGDMSLLTFLKDTGRFARVGTMLAKDSVKSRLESPSGISFTEFCYQLLQGADFVHLYRRHGVRVQIGGSDQWGNITAGTELLRKAEGIEAEEKELCFGLTWPLLTKADGRKFGKSEDGAVWLTADKLSPFKFYQHLLTNVTDAEVVKFLKMLTFLPLSEIADIEADMAKPGSIPNSAQKRLAGEVTRFVHGEKGLSQALVATEALRPGTDTLLDAAALQAIASEAPSATLPREKVVGQPLAELAVAVGLQTSKGAARRLIKGGGFRVNNVKVDDEAAVVTEDNIIDGSVMLLAAGKKNKLLLQLS